jgi:arylformamidase
MRRMLEKNGFEYCGVIYLTDGQERVAYELIVGEESKCTIYDITAELLSAPVYSGDTAPAVTRVRSICQGQRANTSDLTMCAHNGTHIDAPLHFADDSYGIDKIPLEKCVGVAYVVSAEGDIDCDFINQYVPFDCRKLLIKGNAHFLPETAELLAKRGIHLVGVEDQSISSCEVTAVTHTAFLKKEIVLLEGIVLSDVADGKYDLCALPLKIAGIDGAPCRAILIKK